MCGRPEPVSRTLFLWTNDDYPVDGECQQSAALCRLEATVPAIASDEWRPLG